METIIIEETIAVGSNIDTDQIYPGRFLVSIDPEETGSHCLSRVDENITVSLPRGGIVVIGTSFGCGSSRKHAPIALLYTGVSAAVTDSFARIFFRNSISLGLPLVVCRGIGKKVRYGRTLKLDLENDTAAVMETGKCWLCERMGGQALKILEAGGIEPMMRERVKKGGEQCVD